MRVWCLSTRRDRRISRSSCRVRSLLGLCSPDTSRWSDWNDTRTEGHELVDNHAGVGKVQWCSPHLLTSNGWSSLWMNGWIGSPWDYLAQQEPRHRFLWVFAKALQWRVVCPSRMPPLEARILRWLCRTYLCLRLESLLENRPREYQFWTSLTKGTYPTCASTCLALPQQSSEDLTSLFLCRRKCVELPIHQILDQPHSLSTFLAWSSGVVSWFHGEFSCKPYSGKASSGTDTRWHVLFYTKGWSLESTFHRSPHSWTSCPLLWRLNLYQI